MKYFVYLIQTKSNKFKKTYVGYTNNLSERLKLHNSGKGAKSTRGYKWKIIFKKVFHLKSKAMSYEYYLKNNRRLRKDICLKVNK